MIRLIDLIEERDGLARIGKKAEGEPDLLLSLRSAGDMAKKEHRRRLLGPNYHRLFKLRQVHSKRVLFTDELSGRGQDVEADGLLSRKPEEILSVCVADCMPIYLFSEGSLGDGLIGILHSGWKGTGIVSEALKRSKNEWGIAPEKLTAVMGPSIRACCYRVDEERAALFASLWGRNALRWDAAGPHLDLAAANGALLEKEGIEDIRIVDSCTACDERFGSFRREGPEAFTHMLAMIGYFQ
jgi:polyphenol oxidase